MDKFIKDLIKQFKNDLAENNFRNIIYNCPPMFMRQLLDVFQSATITIPYSPAQQYADICCYLSSKFGEVKLCNVDWQPGKDVFVFDASGFTRVKFNELRADLYRLDADLISIDQDWNGVCQLTVRIFNHYGDYYGQGF